MLKKNYNKKIILLSKKKVDLPEVFLIKYKKI